MHTRPWRRRLAMPLCGLLTFALGACGATPSSGDLQTSGLLGITPIQLPDLEAAASPAPQGDITTSVPPAAPTGTVAQDKTTLILAAFEAFKKAEQAVDAGNFPDALQNVQQARATLEQVDTTTLTEDERPLYDQVVKTLDTILVALQQTGTATTTGKGSATFTTQLHSVDVMIGDFAYTPMTLRVKAGTTVSWTNRDDVPHTVTSRDGRFDSGKLSLGATWAHTFDQPGTYAYFCTLHPDMKGQVIVK